MSTTIIMAIINLEMIKSIFKTTFTPQCQLSFLAKYIFFSHTQFWAIFEGTAALTSC